PEALFEHYVAAGNRDRAAVYASRAADKAFAALAFDRAALLYERALELTAPGAADLSALRVRLGDALASAARCPAAAQAYLAAAAAGAPEDALQYQRRAAEQLLISGHLEAGLDVIRTVLRSVGLPLAVRIQSQHGLAMCELASCVAAFYEGRWEHTRGFAERAEQLLLECGGVPWELNTAQLYQTYACYFIGDFPELARRSRTFLSNARERGNRLAGFYCRSGFTNAVWLAADDVAGAERNLNEGVREWPREECVVAYYSTMVAGP